MAKFSYTAVSSNGKTVSGSVEASDRAGVLSLLDKEGMRPLKINEQGGSKSGGKDGHKVKVKSDDVVMFTRQLSAMISAGVPLLRAVSSLGERSESTGLRTILGEVQSDIESGKALADSLEKFPSAFGDVYVNMVRAGEAAGILDDILKRLALQLEKTSSMKKKIKSAMTYPVVLVVIALVAFFGLMIFVIPRIGDIVSDIGGPDAELPPLTEFMMSLSSGIVSYWYIILPAIGGVIYGIMRYIGSPKGKRQFHTLALKIPAIKPIIVKVVVARFARTFSSLMGAGVSVLDSLEITSKAVGNAVFEDALLQAAKDVENGATLSSVIEKNELFPGIVAQMLNVGEETGQTDTVLIKVADFYEEETDLAIDSISSLIEPMMIVFMGGMVGVIAASVMMPIANISSQVEA